MRAFLYGVKIRSYIDVILNICALKYSPGLLNLVLDLKMRDKKYVFEI